MNTANPNIDWSRPFLVPADVTVDASGLDISAMGESVRFEGRVLAADCSAEIESAINIIPGDAVTLSPELRVLSDGRMEEYHYFDGVWSGGEIVVAATQMSGICAFLRCKNVSFFLSLDFPYSRIDRLEDGVTIGCDPLDPLKTGDTYLPHTLTIGAARLTGTMAGRYDRGEIEAFSEYVRARMPVHFRGERPIFSSTCITNRMTDVREGRIFWSMHDNPTLTLDPGTLKEEVRLCAELGIEYYQVFEGFFDWEEDGSTERNLRDVVSLAKSLGVRVGDYMTALELNCWHYNYHDRGVSDPGMCALLEEDLRSGSDCRHYLCYGSDKTVQFLNDTVLRSIKRNGEEMICLDGNAALPCFDSAHGHNPGSLYAHIRGLTRFMQAMNDTSPFFMTWSNAGNWLEFMPKLLWYNQNVYLTDPHPRDYSSSLSNLKYYGDCRREQMVTVHDKYFVPFSAFSNCEYYAFRHSRVDDAEPFEYSFLQGLAVTPNICLGEMRTFLERTSAKRLPYVKAFIRRWLGFIRANIDCWRNVYRLGDAPGAGANECYAHMNGAHGFLCLVNQNQSEQRFEFALDGSIGLSGATGDRYLLSDVYPGEHPIAEQPLPGPLYGDRITLSVPAYSVRYIEIAPYSEPEGLRLYGMNAKCDEHDMTAVFDISESCGKAIPAAVWSPSGNIGSVGIKTAPNVPKYYFESSLSDVKISGQAARFTVNMPRERFERELSLWRVDGAGEYRLTQANSDFCGGYIHNLYDEEQRAHLTVTCGGASPDAPDTEAAAAPKPVALPDAAPPVRRASVYETTLSIPFIEWPAMSNLYGFDELVELVFADNLHVREVRAQLDGKPVTVHEYRYPSAPAMKTYYIELTGEVTSGTHPVLRLEVDWNDGTQRKKFNGETKTQAGAQVVGQ